MRARLPSIAKRLIQFECGADTTVQFRGAIAFPHSAFARVGDLGPTNAIRSPELGRSPFWERSSRALPDPEFCPGE